MQIENLGRYYQYKIIPIKVEKNAIINITSISYTAESSSYKVQILQLKGRKVDELMAEKDSFDNRLQNEMIRDLTKGLNAAAERHCNDRTVQTSVAPDSVDSQISDEGHRKCEESFAAVNCGVRSSDWCSGEEASVASLSVKANNVTVAPATTAVQSSFPGSSGMVAKVSEEPGTSCSAVPLQEKQPNVKPSAGMPVKSEPQDARNRPEDAPEDVRLSVDGGPWTMTEDESSSSDVAFKRLLSSTNPCVRELKVTGMLFIRHRDIIIVYSAVENSLLAILYY